VAAPPAPAVSLRILVVDDNRDAADTQLSGREVHTVHDGVDAVEAAERLQPEVVLLDIGLPGLDGHEVARRIRKRRGSGVTLIAMTGRGEDADRRRSSEAGFDAHLVKPQGNGDLTRWPQAPVACRCRPRHPAV
jgi:CheY-like chemotaxis protein